MHRIYADNAATTALSACAREAMLPYFDQVFGNPSSPHTFGQDAAEALERARRTVASCLNASPSEIYFTSGGSEADNQAILSAAGRRRAVRQAAYYFQQILEHHAVLHTLKKLEREGFEIQLLDVYADGPGPRGGRADGDPAGYGAGYRHVCQQ